MSGDCLEGAIGLPGVDLGSAQQHAMAAGFPGGNQSGHISNCPGMIGTVGRSPSWHRQEWGVGLQEEMVQRNRAEGLAKTLQILVMESERQARDPEIGVREYLPPAQDILVGAIKAVQMNHMRPREVPLQNPLAIGGGLVIPDSVAAMDNYGPVFD